jgi:drug/metabolite transporter (DMT)-like permease
MTRRYGMIFGAFCLLSASGWLLPPVLPWAHCMILALIGVAAMLASGREGWPLPREIAKLAVFSILLLGIPDALAAWAQMHVSGALVTATLALVPVLLVVIAAQVGSDEISSSTRALAPAVLGLGGIFLLLPVDLPASTLGRIALAILLAAGLLIAFASVAIHRVLRRFSIAEGIAVLCLSNALFLLPGALRSGSHGIAIAGSILPALLPCVATALLVVLLREIDPVRLAARYFVVPLLTIVEGYLVLRPELTLRMGVGAVLMASGSAFLVLGSRSDEVSSLSLR